MKRAISIAVLLAVFAAGQVRSETARDWERIAEDTSGIRTERTVVIKDAEAWAALWEEHASVFRQTPALPEVSFEREIVVGVFLGERPSGGYAVAMELEPTLTAPPELVVSYSEKEPDGEGQSTAVMSQPFELRKVPRAYKTVRFVPPQGEARVYQVRAEGAVAKADERKDAAKTSKKVARVSDELHGPGCWTAKASLLFDGKTEKAAVTAGLRDAVAEGQASFIPAGLPPPPGSGKKKQSAGKGLPPPPKKNEGKKLPPPPREVDGKKLPPPPGQNGKPLPPPPGRRLPEPMYPGGPLPPDNPRLAGAERTFSTYRMGYIGYWAGDVYYRKARGVVETSPDDQGDTYVMRLTSNKYQEYIKFYHEPKEDRIYWTSVESMIGSRTRRLEVKFEDRASNPLLPWEKERFVFYLAGTTVGLESSRGAYDYDVSYTFNRRDKDTVKVSMTPVKRHKTSPDPKAVSAGIKKDGGRLMLTVTDKWAKYYSGETLELRVVIKRSVGMSWRNPLGIDPKVIEKTLRLPAKDVQDAELGSLSSLDSGKHYISSWSFRRKDSRISTGGWVRKGEGNSIEN